MIRLLLVLPIAFLVCGCALMGEHDENQIRKLRKRQAAELAAKLANDECERLYNQRPFESEDHIPKFYDGCWRWGRLDPVGYYGLSSEVHFDADGSNPEVTVYFSSDRLEINESQQNDGPSYRRVFKQEGVFRPTESRE
jgi:hypothetical protein